MQMQRILNTSYLIAATLGKYGPKLLVTLEAGLIILLGIIGFPGLLVLLSAKKNKNKNKTEVGKTLF